MTKKDIAVFERIFRTEKDIGTIRVELGRYFKFKVKNFDMNSFLERSEYLYKDFKG